MTLWSYLEAYSPLMVRLCARRSIGGKNVVALGSQEIAIASGLPAGRIVEISWSLDWEEITIGEARAFCAACNFDPTLRDHRDRQSRYAHICRKRYPNQLPQYLLRSPFWRTEFAPMIERLRSAPPPSARSSTPSLKPPTSSAPRAVTHAA